MNTGDTILALSSAPPPAPRVIIRLSGPAAFSAIAPFVQGEVMERRGVIRTGLRLPLMSGVTGQALDVPLTLYLFPGPHSYTAENVAELHLPGSPFLVSRLMELLVQPAAGVRLAEPGEFTARAFLNGRLDLTAAEGVAAAVSASDARQLKAARQLLAGDLAIHVRQLTDDLSTLLALLEAGIDFTDEDVSFIAQDALREGISRLQAAITEILHQGARFGRFSPSGPPTVVLAGRPNAGKSSLMNALLSEGGGGGKEGSVRSVISSTPGSTRDLLWADLPTPKGTLRLTDTAGLEEASGREECGGVHAFIERSMQSRARQAVEQADILVLVHDPADTEPRLTLPREPDLVVETKADIMPAETRAVGAESIRVSSQTGENLATLLARLTELAFGSEGGHGLALTTRHTTHLQEALGHLSGALASISQGDELTAANLRYALDSLGAITGEVSPDDVLGKVFSTFCIGK